MVEVGILAEGPYWRGDCSTHGPLPYYWTTPTAASLDALGHASAHHGSGDVRSA